MLELTQLSAERFSRWFRRHRPDVVVALEKEFLPWLAHLRKKVPADVGFARRIPLLQILSILVGNWIFRGPLRDTSQWRDAGVSEPAVPQRGAEDARLGGLHLLPRANRVQVTAVPGGFAIDQLAGGQRGR